MTSMKRSLLITVILAALSLKFVIKIYCFDSDYLWLLTFFAHLFNAIFEYGGKFLVVKNCSVYSCHWDFLSAKICTCHLIFMLYWINNEGGLIAISLSQTIFFKNCMIFWNKVLSLTPGAKIPKRILITAWVKCVWIDI